MATEPIRPPGALKRRRPVALHQLAHPGPPFRARPLPSHSLTNGFPLTRWSREPLRAHLHCVSERRQLRRMPLSSASIGGAYAALANKSGSGRRHSPGAPGQRPFTSRVGGVGRRGPSLAVGGGEGRAHRGDRLHPAGRQCSGPDRGPALCPEPGRGVDIDTLLAAMAD